MFYGKVNFLKSQFNDLRRGRHFLAKKLRLNVFFKGLFIYLFFDVDHFESLLNF